MLLYAFPARPAIPELDLMCTSARLLNQSLSPFHAIFASRTLFIHLFRSTRGRFPSWITHSARKDISMQSIQAFSRVLKRGEKPFGDDPLALVDRIEITESLTVLTVDQMKFCVFCRPSCSSSKGYNIPSRVESVDHLSAVNDRRGNLLKNHQDR